MNARLQARQWCKFAEGGGERESVVCGTQAHARALQAIMQAAIEAQLAMPQTAKNATFATMLFGKAQEVARQAEGARGPVRWWRRCRPEQG